MTPLLFALAAVAVVVLFNNRPLWDSAGGRGVTLPPLSPIPAPPAPPAGPSTGLPLGTFAPWALVAILACSRFVNHEQPPAPPAPAPSGALDLRGKFVGEQAASDAAITAELLDALATTIEYDAAHDKRLGTGTQLAELRSLAREYRTQGVSLGQRQPLARDAIKAFLDAEVGTDGGPIDDAARARWVKSFREIATEARRAIGR